MTDMKRNKSDKQQVTFRLYVDRLGGEFVNKKRLMPETTYYFGRFEKRAEYSDVVRYLQAVVDHELAYELRKYIDDDDLEVIVKDTFVGSIELLFSVLINTLTVASGIHDVIDLISKISERFVKQRMYDQYDELFSVDVRVLSPGNKHDHCCHAPGGSCWKREPVIVEKQPESFGKRDAFFWYLLVVNILLSVIISVLVAGAVLQVYLRG